MNNRVKSYVPKDYWEERLRGDFSLKGVGHIGFGAHYNKWMYKSRMRCLKRILKRNSIPLKEIGILDIGCGTGFYIDYWKRKGIKDVTGVDITQKSISSMKASYPDYHFIRGDVSDELDMGRKFDIITVFDVFLHITEDSRFKNAIANIKRASKPSSFILIMDIFLKYYTAPNGHEYDKTFMQYARILEENGFEIVDRLPVFVLMSTPINIKSEGARRWANFLWMKLMRGLRKSAFLESAGGAALYLLDGLLTRLARCGPSTEILVCRLKK